MSGLSSRHRLNGICPYFTMFPLSFPLTALQEISDNCSRAPDHRRLGWVLDPFCGRGTTNLASRILGIPSVGIDISPIAVAIASAKAVSPSPEEIVGEAQRILAGGAEPREVPTGEFWELAYHPEVLHDLCKLREALLEQCMSPARIALRGIILGALHGPLSKKIPSYFSNQAPRTFAPKPKYSVSFWRKRGLLPPRVDVLQVIRLRAQRYYSESLPLVETLLVQHDSSNRSIVSVLGDFRRRMGQPCSAVVTSPPYYGMSTYIPDQWLRNWFLGGAAQVDYSTTGQLGRGSIRDYLVKLSRVWQNVASVCEKGSYMVVRFGCISSARIDPAEIFEESLACTGWVIHRVEDAGSPRRGKRQAEAFSCAGAESASEVDVYCVMR